MLHDLAALDSFSDRSIGEILQCWNAFVSCTDSLLGGSGDLSAASEVASSVSILCNYGLRSLAEEHFLQRLEEAFRERAILQFWRQFDKYSASTSDLTESHIVGDQLQELLSKSLEDICSEKNYQEKCLLILVRALQSYEGTSTECRMNTEQQESYLISSYQLMASSVLLTTLPSHFTKLLQLYFKHKLEELNSIVDGDSEDGCDSLHNERILKYDKLDEMNIDESNYDSVLTKNNCLVKSIGRVVLDLRNIGFKAITEDAYAFSIFQHLKGKVENLAGDDYRTPVLESIKRWIQAVPLRFLHDLLSYLGDLYSYGNILSGFKSPLASSPLSYPGIDAPSEGLVRWQLRLEYFAYETLQNLRISKLFEIIVDYPDSSPAIQDLKQCLEHTGQHSKLVDSFISSLQHRLLTAGASTNDILHQYVSTIKALRMIDQTGVFLAAVGEPIREYLRGRKDTIKCIVTMLTDGSGGNASAAGNIGDSLLEELNRDTENQEAADNNEDINADDKQAWINAQRWEPDPVEADPLRGSRCRGKIDILEMLVSIIGSKDQLVNEYRVMLAEKLLNKSDYDIDSEIRTLELLKIHFGESSMQRCEIMLNDLIGSKRINGNIKASKLQSLIGTEQGQAMTLNHLDATIISSNFWPTIQEESLHLPSSVEQVLSDYAERFHEIKTPRKLLWKKNLGIVKLELQFDDRSVEFSVTPIHATIIMQFQDKTSWTSKSLAAAVGIPVDILSKRMSFWISKGVIFESGQAESSDHVFTLVDDITDSNRNDIAHETEGMDEEGERTVSSVEEELQKEMTVYKKFIEGMLTNFGSMTLDRIHNTLKIFCVADPTYDKSLQQLQSFLAVLIEEERLEMRDGQYLLKKRAT